MSEYTLAGVYIEQSSEGLAPTPIDTGRYVAIIGHMTSGSSGYNIEDTDKFATGQTGTVFEFSSAQSIDGGAANRLGLASGTNWAVAESLASGVAGDSPFDPDTNFMRAAELAFLGGASKVYGCVLSGTGSAPNSSPDGLAEALAALRAYEDAYYIVLAGYEPITSVKTEVNSASLPANARERVYVTGVSYNNAFSGSNMVYGLPSTITDIQSDEGRVICLLGNTVHKFVLAGYDTRDSHIPTTWIDGSHEIGGNFMAAYIAGKLSSQEPQTPLSFLTWTPSYKGEENKAIFPQTKLESMWGDYLIFPRRWTIQGSNRWSYDKGWVFVNNPTGEDTDVTLITTRQILDTIAKDARAIMMGKLFSENTESNRTTLNNAILDKLASRKGEGMIKEFSSRVYASATDEANNIMRCQMAIRPIFETLKIIVSLTATLTV